MKNLSALLQSYSAAFNWPQNRNPVFIEPQRNQGLDPIPAQSPLSSRRALSTSSCDFHTSTSGWWRMSHYGLVDGLQAGELDVALSSPPISNPDVVSLVNCFRNRYCSPSVRIITWQALKPST
jgi:hypothetical protein